MYGTLISYLIVNSITLLQNIEIQKCLDPQQNLQAKNIANVN